jgi:hypothetical protein
MDLKQPSTRRGTGISGDPRLRQVTKHDENTAGTSKLVAYAGRG